jgi:hypothetical protein
MTIREQRRADGLCLYCGQPNDRLPKGICTACANRHSALVSEGQRKHQPEPTGDGPDPAPADDTLKTAPMLPRRLTSAIEGDLLRLTFTDAGLTTVVLGLSRAMIHVLVQELAAAVEIQTARARRPPATSLRIV